MHHNVYIQPLTYYIGDKMETEKKENGYTFVVEERTQHSVGSSNGRFGGPDRYVVVLKVPVGQIVPEYLNRKVLAKRGISIIFWDEGYSKNDGKRSMLGIAREHAELLIKKMEMKEEVE